jgi:hypothetical protein
MSNSERADRGELAAAVYALADEELTLCEFRYAVKPFSAEALQVVATILGCRATQMSNSSDRVRNGRSLCKCLAARRRCLN